MKKYHAIGLLAMAMLTACRDTAHQATEGTEVGDTPGDSPTLADSTLWGRLGEDTGMSALQFITDGGDTLELYRTDPYSGQDGRLTGDIRNQTDRFALTLSPDSETMRTAINTTQLAEVWASSDTAPYEDWHVWNGRLVVSIRHQQEMGTAVRNDTMDVLWLDNDSLVLRTPQGEHVRLGK